jgi:hypothetical protein
MIALLERSTTLARDSRERVTTKRGVACGCILQSLSRSLLSYCSIAVRRWIVKKARHVSSLPIDDNQREKQGNSKTIRVI